MGRAATGSSKRCVCERTGGEADAQGKVRCAYGIPARYSEANRGPRKRWDRASELLWERRDYGGNVDRLGHWRCELHLGLDHDFGHRESRGAGVPPARRAGRPSPERDGRYNDQGLHLRV